MGNKQSNAQKPNNQQPNHQQANTQQPNPQQANTQQPNPQQVNTFNNSVNQFNSMIEKSSDALMCGPDCQKTRRTEELKKNYLDAQQNVKYAPIKEENAAKEYYTYTQGTAGYDKYHKKKLTSEIKDIEKTTATNFKKAIDSVKKLAETYDSLYTNYSNVFELYKKYLTENSKIESNINSISTDRVTSDRKSFYEGQGVDSLNGWHVILKWIYLVLLVIYFLFMILSESNYSFTSKFLLLIVFIIYPFIIYYIVMLSYNALLKVYKFLPENAYISI
jgi:hypothetical protein